MPLPEVLTLVGACAPFTLKITMQMRSIRRQHCGSSAQTLYIGLLEMCPETCRHACATKADAASLPDENEAAAGCLLTPEEMARRAQKLVGILEWIRLSTKFLRLRRALISGFSKIKHLRTRSIGGVEHLRRSSMGSKKVYESIRTLCEAVVEDE